MCICHCPPVIHQRSSVQAVCLSDGSDISLHSWWPHSPSSSSQQCDQLSTAHSGKPQRCPPQSSHSSTSAWRWWGELSQGGVKKKNSGWRDNDLLIILYIICQIGFKPLTTTHQPVDKSCPTSDFDSGRRHLISTHTAVDPTVLRHRLPYQEFQGGLPFPHLVLNPILQQLISLPPFYWNSRFGQLTAQHDITSLLSLHVL